jgi:hypothetical protein
MVTRSGQRIALVIVFLAGFITFNAASASAQSSINFTGGGSIDPEQVYAGVSWSSPDLGGRFKIRPGIDGGFGDGLRLANINIDLIVKFPLGTTGWSLIQGGGPVITIAKFSGDFEGQDAELHAGGSYLFGFQHDNGFFADFRVGGGDFVPQLKIGVGWSVEIK